MSAPVVLGLDIGGTWTRALVLDPGTAGTGGPGGAGARLGASRRAGANPTTHGVAAASEHIAAAVAEALAAAGTGAESVAACVIGMAGASKLAGDPAAAAAIAGLWQQMGLRCPVEIVADVTTAFAAGTAEPDGSILLAGTGAIAATLTGRAPVGILGGHGWLLGDEGSGYWIGRQAVRATLAALDEDAAPGRLAAAVLEYFGAPAAAVPAASDFGLGASRRLVAAVIAGANAQPPVRLAALTPLVLAAADDGDRDASRILHETADLLVGTLVRARTVHAARGARGAEDPAAPIVLAGGVLAPGSLVHRLVLDAVTRAWPKAPVTAGVDGAAGAAWLAALHVLGDGREAAALHATLLSGTAGTAPSRTARPAAATR